MAQKGSAFTLFPAQMKRLLYRIGKKMGFMVDVEEPPESELGALGIRHDVLWYTKPAHWNMRTLFPYENPF